MVKTYKVKLNEISKFQQFVNGCVVFSQVSLTGRHGKFIVDAKSVMGLLSLDLSEPVTIEAEADTEKELEAFDKWVTVLV
ncbi:MAG: HPr family phosphocarrier protein [Lachnospiraceae bacterium]|nr:HPr family phosphocarrier protein [Lachnospiraceae bacterium]